MGGRRQFGVSHVGHPDADALLVVTILIGGIPAQAGHRGAGHAGFLKLCGEEEVLGDAVIIQGVEREVAESAGTFTDLGLKRGSSGAAHLDASVVVGGHRAAFAVEVLGVEGNLTVSTVGHGCADHLVLCEDELVHGVVAFCNLGEGQGVVVVQHGVVGRGGNLHEGERGGFLAGKLPNIRHGGIVWLGHDVPDAGRAAFTVQGHHLPGSVGGSAGGKGHFDLLVVGHVEGHLGLHNSEVLLRREVDEAHVRGGTVVAQGEAEGLHPAAVRADADDDGFDNLTVLKGDKGVSHLTATGCGDVESHHVLDCQGGTCHTGIGRVVHRVVTIGINGLAAVGRHGDTGGAAAPRTRHVLDANDQVAVACVGERRTKGERRLDGVSDAVCQSARGDQVACCHAHPCAAACESALAHFLHVHVEVASVGRGVLQPHGQGVDGAAHANLVSSVDLLREGVVVQRIRRQIRIGRGGGGIAYQHLDNFAATAATRGDVNLDVGAVR